MFLDVITYHDSPKKNINTAIQFLHFTYNIHNKENLNLRRASARRQTRRAGGG